MDELDREFFNHWIGYDQVDEFLAELPKHGYIHLPNAQGKSVTIYTSDNPEPLLTEAEWYEKYIAGEIKQADISKQVSPNADSVPNDDTTDDIKDA